LIDQEPDLDAAGEGRRIDRSRGDDPLRAVRRVRPSVELDSALLPAGGRRPAHGHRHLGAGRHRKRRRDADHRIADRDALHEAQAALLADAGAQQVRVLGDRQVLRHERIVAVGDVPPDLERPGDDRLAQVGGRRAEARGGDGELCPPLPARLKGRGDGRLQERVLDEQLALDLYPVVRAGDVPLAVAVILRAGDLVQPKPDQPQGCASGDDLLGRSHADRSGDPVADSRRLIQGDLAQDPAIGRLHELLRQDRVERVAPLRPGEPRAVDGVERRRRRPGAVHERAEPTEVHRERHCWISLDREDVGGGPRRSPTLCRSRDTFEGPPRLPAIRRRVPGRDPAQRPTGAAVPTQSSQMLVRRTLRQVAPGASCQMSTLAVL